MLVICFPCKAKAKPGKTILIMSRATNLIRLHVPGEQVSLEEAIKGEVINTKASQSSEAAKSQTPVRCG